MTLGDGNHSKIQPTKKAYMLLGLSILFIAFISVSHGITEAWAWEVAKALITINGLVLGFVIFGATILSRGSFAEVSIRKAISRGVEKLVVEAKKQKNNDPTLFTQWLNENGRSILREPLESLFYDIKDLKKYLEISLLLILVSIGLSFCLFGVSPTTASNPTSSYLFFFAFYNSLISFVLGVYIAYRVFFHLLERSFWGSIKDPDRLTDDIVNQKFEEFSSKEKESAI